MRKSACVGEASLRKAVEGLSSVKPPYLTLTSTNPREMISRWRILSGNIMVHMKLNTQLICVFLIGYQLLTMPDFFSVLSYTRNQSSDSWEEGMRACLSIV